MINYITKNLDNKVFISDNFDCFVLDMPLTKLFNEMLLKELTTFNARIKVIKKRFNFKSKVPLIIDKDTLLMNIKSHRGEKSLYLNFFSIYKYEVIRGAIHVFFHNNHVMKIAERYAFIEQWKRCEFIARKI